MLELESGHFEHDNGRERENHDFSGMKENSREFHLLDPKEFNFDDIGRDTEHIIGELSKEFSTKVGVGLEKNIIDIGILSFEVGLKIGFLFDSKGQKGGWICGQLAGKANLDANLDLSKGVKSFVKFIAIINKVELIYNQQKGEISNSFSLGVNGSAYFNSLPTSKGVEFSLLADSNNNTQKDYGFKLGLGENVGLEANIRVEGCMTLKQEPYAKYSGNLFEKW